MPVFTAAHFTATYRKILTICTDMTYNEIGLCFPILWYPDFLCRIRRQVP